MSGVNFRHHQDMTGVHGLDIHKRRAASVTQDDTRGQPSRKYLAENTTVHANNYGTIRASAAVSKPTVL
jgi:hypothetical protein